MRPGPTLVHDPVAHYHLHTPQRTLYSSHALQQLPSPPRRRSTSHLSSPASMPRQQQNWPTTPLVVSPTLSTLSSLSSAGDSPSYRTSVPVVATVGADEAPLNVKGKEKAAVAPKKVKKERQTRIQEHLRTVKPGSASPSSSKATPLTATAVTTPNKVISKRPAPKRNSSTTLVETAQLSQTPVEPTQSPSARPVSKISVLQRRDVEAMPDAEVQVRLEHEKKELMDRLAEHDIRPSIPVLDRVLTMDHGAEGLSVQSFLLALSSIEAGATDQASTPTPASVNSTTLTAPHTSTFSTLESTSSSPAISRLLPAVVSQNSLPPVVRIPTPTPVKALSPTAGGGTPNPTTLAPSPEILTGTPSVRRIGRLQAFGGPRSSSSLVAAEVGGMGRVAMARERLVKTLGSVTAAQAIAAAQEPLPKLSFGAVRPPAATASLLSAFGDAPPTSRSASDHPLTESPVVDDRLGMVKSWLDSAELTDEEEDAAWSTIPKEWVEDLEALEEYKHKSHQVVPYVDFMDDADEDLLDGAAEEIRVGGKSVRVLLRTKRRRAEEEETGEIRGEANKEDDASDFDRKRHGLSSSDASDDHCVCHRGDEGEPMVQCDDCRTWYHLSCLHIPSARRLGKTWFCFRCDHASTPAFTASKRPKYQAPSTPVFEPTFVPSAASPQPTSNFYAAPDVVLAPSPLTTSARRFVPRSPVASAPAPRTPQLGQARADYAPCSPQVHRTARMRMASATFEPIPAATFLPASSAWEHGQPPSYGYDDLGTRVAEEEYLWQCSTPSRSLSSAALGGWSEVGLQTPETGSRRRRLASNSSQLMATPSQEFLSTLHQHPEPPMHAFSQRLFSSPAQGVVPSSSHMYYATPASPAGGQRGAARTHHRRSSSLSIFPSTPSVRHPTDASQWVTPFPNPVRRSSPSRTSHLQHSLSSPIVPDESAFPAKGLQRDYRSPDLRGHPQSSGPSASGMTRSASGLGIGFEGGMHLDELLPFESV